MSVLTLLVVIWGTLTVLLLALVIVRSFVGLGEEDQIFLDRAEAALENEQREVTQRINRLDPIIKVCAIASGGLLLVIVVWWIYRGLYGPVVI